MSMWDDDGLSRFSGPGYLLALFLLGAPVLDWLLTTWPAQPMAPAWRYAAVGLFSTTIVMPMLGLWIASIIAGARAHTGILAALTVLHLFVAVALLAAGVDFTVNLTRMQGMMEPGDAAGYWFGGVRISLKLLASAAFAAWLAVNALRARRAILSPTDDELPFLATARR